MKPGINIMLLCLRILLSYPYCTQMKLHALDYDRLHFVSCLVCLVSGFQSDSPAENVETALTWSSSPIQRSCHSIYCVTVIKFRLDQVHFHATTHTIFSWYNFKAVMADVDPDVCSNTVCWMSSSLQKVNWIQSDLLKVFQTYSSWIS